MIPASTDMAAVSAPGSPASSAASMPHRDAAVPEIRESPVAGLSWNNAPRANEPGKEAPKKSDRKRRWAAPLSPAAAASASDTAQPMSSWQRT